MRSFMIFFLALVVVSPVVLAQSNVDPSNKYAWSENIGWINWRGEAEPGQGVFIGSSILSGFAWSENIGWINFGDGTPADGISYANVDGSDFGVNIDYDNTGWDGTADGTLHGMAWSENAGWINFDGGALATPPAPARIDCAGRLNGYAWGENIGWINLAESEPGKFVSLEADAIPVLCDLNEDGLADGRDVQSLVDLILVFPEPTWREVCSGDIEATPDGTIDIDDVAAFVGCLLN